MVAVANAFRERIILSLLPFFLVATPNRDEARAAVVAALTSYGARTQHDLTETAQILALGFSTVDSLADSTDRELEINTRLKLRANAVALVRSKKTCAQALSDNRHLSDSPHVEVGEYAETAEPVQAEQVPEDAQPAAPASIFELARDRGHQREDAGVGIPPETTTVPSPVATHPAGALVVRQAAIPRPDEPDQDAMPWAGVMNHTAGNHTGAHATG